MGTISRPLLLLLSIFSVVALYSAPIRATSSSQVHEAFLECLVDRSEPTHPISAVIYTPNNTAFTSVLNAYVRNLRFNTSTTPKPFLILTALHESHVQSAVLCAQTHNLQMKIRSGGHDYEAVSYVSLDVPFFVLDMFNLRSIDIDVKAKTAWVGAGAILGEVYYRIQEKSKVLGFPAGVCPTVGVGGHLSGGGYGNMMRKYGLTVDHVVDATIVDVRGRVLDRASMGEDLFWAIRGGGGASFGVVLSYKINLVPVPKNVTVFQVRKTVLDDNATDIVLKWEEVSPFLPEELFIRMTLDVVNSTTQAGKKTVRATFIAFFLGDSKTLLSIMSKSFPELGLEQSDCIETGWLQSILFWTNIAMDTPVEILLSRTPSVSFLKRKSDYVQKAIPRDGLEFIFEKLLESEIAMLTFNPYGGKMAEIPDTATPFPHRAGNLWKVQYAANWNQEGANVTEHYINILRKLYGYMTPYVSKNPRAAFFNYKDLDLGINHNGRKSYLEGMVYGIKYFKGNFKRLVEIKTKVDPANFFRNEQSIPTLPYGNGKR